MAKRKRSAAGKAAPKLSPLLRSAFEVLNHGLWHFFRSDTSTDLKFARLHVDQAIELILKECVRANGKSIYRNPKETITIWGAYDILSALNVPIPERPDLEMLHEERNSIQHKYANLSAEDATFHIDNAMKFIRGFLKNALKVDIKDYISAEYLDQFQ